MAYDDFSMNDSTLIKCKKHNRYQRQEFWQNKSINKLLRAIQLGYVPVGKSIPKIQTGKRLIKSGE